MNYFLDVHCHTIASGHAYSTVTENAAHAASIGLTHIAITDHGPAMDGGACIYSFMNMGCVPDYIHGVRVLKGAEANIMDSEGRLDISDGVLKRLDFAIASLHRAICTPSTKEDNTQAMVKAMENPMVNILGHPGDRFFDIDFEAVAAAAARTGTIIEINNQTLNPDFGRYNGDAPQRQLLALCKAYGVPVIASSDAHFHTLVGKLDYAKALIEEAGLPESQVLNTSAELFFAAVQRKHNACRGD